MDNQATRLTASVDKLIQRVDTAFDSMSASIDMIEATIVQHLNNQECPEEDDGEIQ